MNSQTPSRHHWNAFLAAVFVATALVAYSRPALAQQVIVFVNGQPVTTMDYEHRAKFIQLSTRKAPARKDVMDSIIDDLLEIDEAKRFGIDVPDEEVDKSFATVATRMGIDAKRLSDILAHDGASADTLKRRLRAQVAWNALVRGRYKASLEIRDSDVEAKVVQQLKPDDKKKDVGYEYIMRPIIFIVAQGSPDLAFEARKHEADALRSRFVNCADGVPFARALSEVAVRDQVSKFSADLPEQLRGILDSTAIGHLTPPETTKEGVQMFAICAKKETKTDTPEMRVVRDQLFQQKFSATAKHYLERLHRAAMIEYKMPEYQ